MQSNNSELKDPKDLKGQYNLDELLLSASSSEDGEHEEAMAILTKIMVKTYEPTNPAYLDYVDVVNKFCEKIGFTSTKFEAKQGDQSGYFNPNWSPAAYPALVGAVDNKIPSALYSNAIYFHQKNPSKVAGANLFDKVLRLNDPQFSQLALEVLNQEHLNKLQQGYGYYLLGVHDSETSNKKAEEYFLKAANAGSLQGCVKAAEMCSDPLKASELYCKSKDVRALSKFKTLVIDNTYNMEVLKNYAEFLKETAQATKENLAPLQAAFDIGVFAVGMLLADFANDDPVQKAFYLRSAAQSLDVKISKPAYAALKKLSEVKMIPNVIAYRGLCRWNGDGTFTAKAQGLKLLTEAATLADKNQTAGDVAYYALAQIAEKDNLKGAIDAYLKALWCEGAPEGKANALARIREICAQEALPEGIDFKKIADELNRAILEGAIEPVAAEEIKALKEAVTKGNIHATFALAQYYANEKGLEFNLIEAGRLFAKVLEAKDSVLSSLVHEALVKLDNQYHNPQILHALSLSNNLQGRYLDGFKCLVEAAKKGHERSALIVAQSYIDNERTQEAIEHLGIAIRSEKCREEAVKLLEPYIEKSVTAAIYYLHAKVAIKADDKQPKVIKLLELASEKGHLEAQLELAQAYFTGAGVEKDLLKSTQLTIRVINNPYKDQALLKIAEGLLVKLADSSENHSVVAKMFLAESHRGKGVEADSKTALEYYTKVVQIEQLVAAKSLLVTLHQINAIEQILEIFLEKANTLPGLEVENFAQMISAFEASETDFDNVKALMGSEYTVADLKSLNGRLNHFNSNFSNQILEKFADYQRRFVKTDWKPKGFSLNALSSILRGQVVPQGVTEVTPMLQDSAVSPGEHLGTWLALAEKMEQTLTAASPEPIDSFLHGMREAFSELLKDEGLLVEHVVGLGNGAELKADESEIKAEEKVEEKATAGDQTEVKAEEKVEEKVAAGDQTEVKVEEKVEEKAAAGDQTEVKAEEKAAAGDQTEVKAEEKVEEKVDAGDQTEVKAEEKVEEKAAAGDQTEVKTEEKVEEKAAAGDQTEVKAEEKVEEKAAAGDQTEVKAEEKVEEKAAAGDQTEVKVEEKVEEKAAAGDQTEVKAEEKVEGKAAAGDQTEVKAEEKVEEKVAAGDQTEVKTEEKVEEKAAAGDQTEVKAEEKVEEKVAAGDQTEVKAEEKVEEKAAAGDQTEVKAEEKVEEKAAAGDQTEVKAEEKVEEKVAAGDQTEVKAEEKVEEKAAAGDQTEVKAEEKVEEKVAAGDQTEVKAEEKVEEKAAAGDQTEVKAEEKVEEKAAAGDQTEVKAEEKVEEKVAAGDQTEVKAEEKVEEKAAAGDQTEVKAEEKVEEKAAAGDQTEVKAEEKVEEKVAAGDQTEVKAEEKVEEKVAAGDQTEVKAEEKVEEKVAAGDQTEVKAEEKVEEKAAAGDQTEVKTEEKVEEKAAAGDQTEIKVEEKVEEKAAAGDQTEVKEEGKEKEEKPVPPSRAAATLVVTEENLLKAIDKPTVHLKSGHGFSSTSTSQQLEEGLLTALEGEDKPKVRGPQAKALTQFFSNTSPAGSTFPGTSVTNMTAPKSGSSPNSSEKSEEKSVVSSILGGGLFGN